MTTKEYNKNNFIDIEKVIAEKNPKLLKWIPKFAINYVNKLFQLNEINSVISENSDKDGVDFANGILNSFGCKTLAVNCENIPKQGRYILVANHPLGGIDGMAFIKEVGKIRKDILFPVNDVLLNIENLNSIFIPINKFGRNSDNIQALNNAFESDKLVLFFPAGLASRKNDDKTITDPEWKKTFITKAKQYKRDIIPVFIDGRNSNFFYNFARFRKKLGIKINLEQFFLPKEMIKQKGVNTTLIFGKPIEYKLLDNSKSQNEWAETIKHHVYALKSNPDLDFKY